jgi:hypothetical protein
VTKPKSRVYASAEMLGDDGEDTTDVQLRTWRGVWVKVRLLDQPEVAEQQFLPDLADYVSLIKKLQSPEEGEPFTDRDARLLTKETMRWQSHIAHLAIVDPDADPAPAECASCTTAARVGDLEAEPVVHRPSLWTLRQTARLKSPDLTEITAVALLKGAMKRIVPFSTEETDTATPSPATSGELTPAKS